MGGISVEASEEEDDDIIVDSSGFPTYAKGRRPRSLSCFMSYMLYAHFPFQVATPVDLSKWNVPRRGNAFIL